MRRRRFARAVLGTLEARGVGVAWLGGSRWALIVPRGTVGLEVFGHGRAQPLEIKIRRNTAPRKEDTHGGP